MKNNLLITIMLIQIFSCTFTQENQQNIAKFVEAARKGDLETVKTMLKERTVSIDDQSTKHNNQTALIGAIYLEDKKHDLATINKKIEVARYLLDVGANRDIGGMQVGITWERVPVKDKMLKKQSALKEVANSIRTIGLNSIAPLGATQAVRDALDDAARMQKDAFWPLRNYILDTTIDADLLLQFSNELNTLSTIIQQ